jgi:hypothetical protein
MKTDFEAPLSADRSAAVAAGQYAVAPHPASANLSASRSSRADRLALRLGLALVIWGRRNIEHVPDRFDRRDRAVAGFVAELARCERELGARRLLLLELPRR